MADTFPAHAPARRRKEIYTYEAPWTIYGLSASQRPGRECEFRFALGSFMEEYANKVQIVQLDEERNEFVARGTFEHPYPATKVMWAPEPLARERDLLATSGDYLRLWAVSPSTHGGGGGGDGAAHAGPDVEVKQEALLNNNKNSDYCAPLTSFDWNTTEPSLMATSSIDTTVSVWDVAAKRVKTQLIAHDKEVYDVCWAPRSHDVFGTVGADGSLRLFDLRSLEHSTIMYDAPGGGPLLRLAWNGLDANYIATFGLDSTRCVVLDIRMPAVPVAEMGGHAACVNGVAWAPHSAAHVCTVGDDAQALIWDLASIPKPVEDPILAYTAEAEVNAIAWAPSLPEWVTIAFDAKVQMLKV